MVDSNNENRCRKRISKNKRCRRLALGDGYCALHQKNKVDMKFWRGQAEDDRLLYLQQLAEVRAINAHKLSPLSDRGSDLIFNRNLRIATGISKLRHSIEQKDSVETSDDWLEVLQDDRVEKQE